MKVSVSDLLLLMTSVSVGLAVSAADMRLSDPAILASIWLLIVAKSWIADRISLLYLGIAFLCATVIVLPTHFEMLHLGHWAFPYAVSDFTAIAFIAACFIPLLRDIQRSNQWKLRHLFAAILMLTFTLLSFTECLNPAFILVGNGTLALWLIQRALNEDRNPTLTEPWDARKSPNASGGN